MKKQTEKLLNKTKIQERKTEIKNREERKWKNYHTRTTTTEEAEKENKKQFQCKIIKKQLNKNSFCCLCTRNIFISNLANKRIFPIVSKRFSPTRQKKIATNPSVTKTLYIIHNTHTQQQPIQCIAQNTLHKTLYRQI